MSYYHNDINKIQGFVEAVQKYSNYLISNPQQEETFEDNLTSPQTLQKILFHRRTLSRNIQRPQTPYIFPSRLYNITDPNKNIYYKRYCSNKTKIMNLHS